MAPNNVPETTVVIAPGQVPTGQVSITLATLPLDTLKRYSSPKPLRRPQLPRPPLPDTEK